eukprot:TRINITY_DN10767_c0_g1_i2.p1 TRINITY_DN10767_c0_g1~~TRINITY_DN10767_c0_g1_i2.p1  ORF type:complete len:100 (+),score=3.84 TRINITY_DN10767_c0_g1_i2:47-346(+)
MYYPTSAPSPCMLRLVPGIIVFLCGIARAERFPGAMAGMQASETDDDVMMSTSFMTCIGGEQLDDASSSSLILCHHKPNSHTMSRALYQDGYRCSFHAS